MPPITKKEFLARKEEFWKMVNLGIEENVQKYQDKFTQEQIDRWHRDRVKEEQKSETKSREIDIKR